MIRTTQIVLFGVLNDEFVAGLVDKLVATTVTFSSVCARLVCRCCAFGWYNF